MTAEYRRISPGMKCPVLKHDKIVIEDTLQIMRYFAKKAFQIEEGERLKNLYDLKNRMEVEEIDRVLLKY
jgi:glutathione S-transferase